MEEDTGRAVVGGNWQGQTEKDLFAVLAASSRINLNTDEELKQL